MIDCTRAEALIHISHAMYCLRFLEANKITHIVNLAADGPNAPETVKNNEVFRDRPDFVYYSINVGDQIEGAVALMQALRGGCLKFIFDALKDGHRVLCHCHKVRETDVFVATKSHIFNIFFAGKIILTRTQNIRILGCVSKRHGLRGLSCRV